VWGAFIGYHVAPQFEIDDIMSSPKPYYPELTPDVKKFLTLVPKLMQTHADYLTHPECPYEEEVVLLQRLFAPQNQELNPKNIEFYLNKDIDIAEESQALYWEIKTVKANMGTDETSEKVAVFRLMTTLLEKILTLKEKAEGLEHFEQFKTMIINTLDRYLDSQQKSDFCQQMDDMFGPTKE